MSQNPAAQSQLDDLIGFFTALPEDGGYRVVGPCCKDKVPHQSPVYRANVEPYRQGCSCCGAVLVEGRSPVWPELFTGA